MSLRTYARSRGFAFWLTLIVAVGSLLRVVYILSVRHDPVVGDGFRYHWGASFLADGEGFVAPLALFLRNVRIPDTGHPPGWTVVLAAPALFGLRSWLEQQIFTSIIGAGTIAMTGLAGRAAFGRRAGLIAAGLAAVYPFIWLYEREVLSEPLALLGVATTIWLAYRFIERPGPVLAAALGAVVGALAMTKSDQSAIAVVLVVPLILSRRGVDLWRRFGWLVLAGGACVVLMAPWSIYLSTRFDRPVVVAGSLGGAMAAGNCRATYDGELLGYFSNTCTFGVPDRSGGDPLLRDEQLRRRALDFMREHKSRVPAVMIARVGRTFGFYRPFQQVRLETVRGTSEAVIWIGLGSYWVLLPLAAAGAVIARRRRIPIYPLLAFSVVVVLSVLVTIGAVRYRAPAEIPLVILAAFALDVAIAAWRNRGTEAKGRPTVPTRG